MLCDKKSCNECTVKCNEYQIVAALEKDNKEAINKLKEKSHDQNS